MNTHTDTCTDVPRGQSEVVMVIDDDKEFLMVIKAQLESLGYTTLCAKDSNTAYEILKKSERIDVLLTDLILLNDVNGRQIAGEFKKQMKEIKILFMSGYPVHANIHTGLSEGKLRFLKKPFSQGELAKKMSYVLNH